MRNEIVELLNRQFTQADIKQYLINKGYAEDEVNAELKKVLSERNSKTINKTQATVGFISLVVGILFLLLQFNTVKIQLLFRFIGIGNIAFGIWTASKFIKDE